MDWTRKEGEVISSCKKKNQPQNWKTKPNQNPKKTPQNRKKPPTKQQTPRKKPHFKIYFLVCRTDKWINESEMLQYPWKPTEIDFGFMLKQAVGNAILHWQLSQKVWWLCSSPRLAWKVLLALLRAKCRSSSTSCSFVAKADKKHSLKTNTGFVGSDSPPGSYLL